MIDDPDRCYAALDARDPRFDGWFYVGVTSTGIYCRPSCPARTPRRANVRFHATAASAQAAGFRACKRCRPDATPGSPAWDHRADLVARAMRLIADGVVDREGVVGLAARLGYTSRHVHRQLVAEVGAGPLALARAQRTQTARVLIETTSLPFADVAFGAGFASIRQFNDTVREVFATTPSRMRAVARRGRPPAADTITLRLAHRTPFAAEALFAHLAARAIPGVEAAADGGHRRSLTLPYGTATVTLMPERARPVVSRRSEATGSPTPSSSGPPTSLGSSASSGAVRAMLRLDDLRDLTVAVQRLRRLLDLDADPQAVDAHLRLDPALRPLVAARPGVRVAGAVDGMEAATRAVLGQQVSIGAAAVAAGRLVARVGTPLRHPDGTVTHRFPDAAAIADADLGGLGVPASRTRTLQAVARAMADGDLDLDAGADRSRAIERLLAIRGVGPWTAAYVALRGLHDPDAFPATDLVLRRSAAEHGLPGDAVTLTAHAERWRPWRAYAAQHLWTAAVSGATGDASTGAAGTPSSTATAVTSAA